MDEIKDKIIGGIVSVVIIGGGAFAVSQTDVLNNFTEETGMSQEEAQQYIDDSEENMDTWTNVGQQLIDDANKLLALTEEIDCVNYEYEWETATLSCSTAKNQLVELGNNDISLGECYKTLDVDANGAAQSRIDDCVSKIDVSTKAYDYPAVLVVLTAKQIDDSKKTNLYNKSILRAAKETE